MNFLKKSVFFVFVIVQIQSRCSQDMYDPLQELFSQLTNTQDKIICMGLEFVPLTGGLSFDCVFQNDIKSNVKFTVMGFWKSENQQKDITKHVLILTGPGEPFPQYLRDKLNPEHVQIFLKEYCRVVFQKENCTAEIQQTKGSAKNDYAQILLQPVRERLNI